MNTDDLLYDVFQGRNVLVTGGTGSFGQAFIKEILPYARRVVAFSRDEQKHHKMQIEFANDQKLRHFIGDVTDYGRMARAFHGVEIVVHAAAMKHVHLCEYNPQEAVDTNVEGARNVVDAAIDCGVKKVVSLSTDKAVAPVNLYGATKLVAEKIAMSGNFLSAGKTKFCAVRYGNVMGSKGSVIPLWESQAFLHSRMTITDPNMTRFMLSLHQAIRTVAEALYHTEGGEIYVPYCPSVSMPLLAKAIDETSYLERIGRRPGEKLHETLLAPEEVRRTFKLTGCQVMAVLSEFDHLDRREFYGGVRVPEDFTYYSGNPQLVLSLEDTKDLYQRWKNGDL